MRRPSHGIRRRQQGVVAIMVGLMTALLVLTGMLALVIDLGALYVTKTELQNAADAAALAGAQELDGTKDGIPRAIKEAIDTAKENSVRLGDSHGAVAINEDHIDFAPNPNGGWIAASVAKGLKDVSTLRFIKVDTSGNGQGRLDTWFRRVGGATSTNTHGLAVAGPYSVNITPLGICAIDPGNERIAGPNNELLEWGFRRGMNYNIPELNPLANLTQDPIWINPVDTVTCDPNHSNANFMRPYVCAGSSVLVRGGLPDKVFINTGTSSALNDALNTRFGDKETACPAALAPPDTNIQPYAYDATEPASLGDDWMNPAQLRQSVRMETDVKTNRLPEPLTETDFGVLWAYNPAVKFDGASATGVGEPFKLSDWPALYQATNGASAAARTADESTEYPGPYGAGGDGSGTPPYRTTGKYFQNGGTDAVAERRILNVLIINCSVPPGGTGACQSLAPIGIGRFFMTVKADLPKEVHGEFAGLIPSKLLRRTIRLYR